LIVDGGASQVGIESTVLDLTVVPARILRPGMIHAESLAAAGLPVAHGPASAGTPALRSPGLLKKHYAPKAKLLVLSWRNEADLRSQIDGWREGNNRVHIVAHTQIPTGFAAASISVIPHDAAAFARALYAELYRCDAAGAQVIVVETPPATPEWAGIADRLRRAAA
jgi:L-threonylcarbamoyladenylate synthase